MGEGRREGERVGQIEGRGDGARGRTGRFEGKREGESPCYIRHYKIRQPDVQPHALLNVESI